MRSAEGGYWDARRLGGGTVKKLAAGMRLLVGKYLKTCNHSRSWRQGLKSPCHSKRTFSEKKRAVPKTSIGAAPHVIIQPVLLPS